MGAPKTVLAFMWTCEELFAKSPRVYFWTMTAVETMPAWYFPPMWNAFARRLIEKLGKFKGVRVFHWHVNHGLHVHFLCNIRIPVQMVRRLSKPYGFGIVDVKLADRNAPKYLARYLGKDLLKMPSGGRAWARIGGVPFGTKVHDIRERSERADYIRTRGRELRHKGGLSPFRALEQARNEYDGRLAREWLEDERNTEILKQSERLFVLDDTFPRWNRRERNFSHQAETAAGWAIGS